jgi:hypothetical protein
MLERLSTAPEQRPETAPRSAEPELFWPAAGLALALHAWLALGREGLVGGGDLVPHLALIRATELAAGIYNPYAPAYHLAGAIAVPWIGAMAYAAAVALAGALLLIAGFRSLQLAAQLPDAAAAVFALTPYLLSLSWCTPRIEAIGYGLLLFGLAAQLRGRRSALACLLAACFWVHTASALLFGIAAGALALLRRDVRDLAALAAGSLGAAPLVASHLAAGCSLPAAFLFAAGGYSRALSEPLLPENSVWLLPLANPIALLAGLSGAATLWRRSRVLAGLCALILVLYLNNFWLAPFGQRTLVTPLRGLSLLAIPVAIAAGALCAERPQLARWLVFASALWALASPLWLVPKACFVRPISQGEIDAVAVDRCSFRWTAPARGVPSAAPLAPARAGGDSSRVRP